MCLDEGDGERDATSGDAGRFPKILCSTTGEGDLEYSDRCFSAVLLRSSGFVLRFSGSGISSTLMSISSSVKETFNLLNIFLFIFVYFIFIETFFSI